jgi:hypothetical protein
MRQAASRSTVASAPVQPIRIDDQRRDNGASNLPPQHIGLFVAIAALH